MAVADDLDLFDGDETTAQHRLGRGDELLDLVGGIDDLDDEGQVFGKAENLSGAEAARPARSPWGPGEPSLRRGPSRGL